MSLITESPAVTGTGVLGLALEVKLLQSKRKPSGPNPVLATERLRLRPFRNDDASRIRLLAGDWDVARMTRTIPHPYPEGAARAWLDRTAGMIDQGLLRQHAITRKDDSLLIGCLTLRKVSATDEEAELGYWLGKPFWGCGYMVEAAGAALSDAAVTFDLVSAIASVLPTNQRLIRVLEKLGFAFGETIESQGPSWDGKVELSICRLRLGIATQP